jgi:hypothetical protein
MTSNNEQQTEQWSEAQVNDWVRSQFQKANLHLAEKGVLMDSVAVQDSRYLPPYVAVWKINALDKQSYWVISGDLPTDHIELKAAENARDALRAFSFRWQIKAQQLVDAGIEAQTAADYANLLVNRAQSLYQLFESEKIWG